jgi:MtN3 and saliva related transmembrane protein
MAEIIGYIACILTTLSQIPQIYSIIKYKKVEGISLAYYFVLLVSILFWVVYGILIGDKFVTFCNIIVVIFILTIMFLINKYKNQTKNPQ